jgi:serine/threonine protein phosphatase 1
MQLLEALAPNSNDQVYFLGDLIDRGPKSAQVLEFVQQSHHNCVLGNHEQLLLDAFPANQVSQSALYIWLQSGGQTTIASYPTADGVLKDIEWLRTLPTYLDLGDLWLVHAGVHPDRPIEAQSIQEFCWIREVFHSSPQPYFSDKLIISGHTITFTMPGVSPGALARGPGWLGIDTGAYHPKSGWLTGVDVTQQRVYQVHVFQNKVRVLPLAEATVEVEPAQVARRRQLLQL